MAKILFIQSLFVEQFGVMTLSAVAKARGHKVDLAIGTDKEILQKAHGFKPDVVGFSVMTGYQKKYLSLGRDLKKSLTSKPLILFGGPHATLYQKVVLEDGVDVVCQGEGEGALVEILDAIDARNSLEGINNLVLKKDGTLIYTPMRPLVDLDEIPFPDREIYRDYPIIYKTNLVSFMASRGCPYSCSFCFNKEMSDIVKGCGTWVRFRSLDNLIEEIDRIHQNRKIRYIHFSDSIFILRRDWLMKFLEAYANKFSIPFTCLIRADLITLEIAKALKESGCYRVYFGLESGDEELRNLVLKKRLSNEQIQQAADVLHKVRLPFFTTNMMGLPGERLEKALKTLELNIAIGTKCAWVSIFQPFPGTNLANYCLQKGYLDKPISTDEPVDTHTNSLLHQPDINKIVRLQKFAYIAVRFPWTLPLIKKLINYNFSTLYYYIHRISYLIFFFRKFYELTWKDMIIHSWFAWKYYRK